MVVYVKNKSSRFLTYIRCLHVLTCFLLWHPIKFKGGWGLPCQIAQASLSFRSSVYSVLLTPHRQNDGHTIEVGGPVGATVGHGLAHYSKNNVRGAALFGQLSSCEHDCCSTAHIQERASSRWWDVEKHEKSSGLWLTSSRVGWEEDLET